MAFLLDGHFPAPGDNHSSRQNDRAAEREAHHISNADALLPGVTFKLYHGVRSNIPLVSEKISRRIVWRPSWMGISRPQAAVRRPIRMREQARGKCGILVMPSGPSLVSSLNYTMGGQQNSAVVPESNIKRKPNRHAPKNRDPDSNREPRKGR